MTDNEFRAALEERGFDEDLIEGILSICPPKPMDVMLDEIKEFFQNDLKERENEPCVKIYRDKIEEILKQDLFKACHAIQVFLLFNCNIYDTLELELKPLWVHSLYKTIQVKRSQNQTNTAGTIITEFVDVFAKHPSQTIE